MLWADGDAATMGIFFSRVFNQLFGSKEVRTAALHLPRDSRQPSLQPTLPGRRERSLCVRRRRAPTLTTMTCLRR